MKLFKNLKTQTFYIKRNIEIEEISSRIGHNKGLFEPNKYVEEI